MSPEDVEAQLGKEPPDLSDEAKAVRKEGMLQIAWRNGNFVLLRNVATVKIERKPDCIVRTYPTGK